MAPIRSCALLSFLALAVLAPSSLAVEQTCEGCIQACCEWSLAASGGNPFAWFIKLHSRDPVRCVDIVAEYGPYSQEFNRCSYEADMRCLRKNCFRCANTYASRIPLPFFDKLGLPGHYGVNGTKPLTFVPGEVIVIKLGSRPKRELPPKPKLLGTVPKRPRKARL